MVSEKTLEHPVLTLMVFTLLGLMGIFSLDLSKPLVLNADTEDEQLVRECFADFIGEE